MAVSCFWRQTRDSESWPNVSVGIQNTNVVQVTIFDNIALVQTASFQFCFLQFETTVYNQVITDQNGCMALSWCWCRTTAFWALPCHNFKVKNVNIVVVVLAIPSTKDIHFRSSDNISRVVEPGRWSASTSWSLIPSHGYWVESVQILESLVLSSFATKNNNSRAC